MKLNIISLLVFILYGCSVGPRTFDDCVLDNMKGTQSDLAARAIYDACYNKFNEEDKK